MSNTDHAGVRITVIGLNARGAALASALAAAGNTVTVWDEAGQSDKEHVAADASRAGSLEVAFAAAALIILCVEDYEAARRILERADRHAVHDVVNLTSGTSAQARETATWLVNGGGCYLDGALMAHPEHVGKHDTVLVYSGSEEVFNRHAAVLGQLGGATYLGPDAGVAALYDLAMLNFAWATLTGFLHTVALLGTAQVQARTVAPLLQHWLSTTITEVITDYAWQVDAREYPGDEEWLELDAPLMDHLVHASEEHGLDTALPQLIRALTSKGIAAGHGKDSYASLIEIMRN
ncbi:NAD(P)-binding domain-containing protein [Streptosporangium sp. NBC_01495]|uniref:imine reductase family protein n=1 Tax=Streptosporangium sp. NBC_01495 TaxID=2903899 RepID=UPI002E33FE8C|nr:NAD(P)-binding domain-containing protein [Streptosporangium sp. NBC_01495]